MKLRGLGFRVSGEYLNRYGVWLLRMKSGMGNIALFDIALILAINSLAIIAAIYIMARVLFHWDGTRHMPSRNKLVWPSALDAQEEVEQEKDMDLDDQIDFAEDADEQFEEVR